MELIAEKREKLGKATKTLKTNGVIPGVIFGKDFDSLPVSVERLIFKKVFDNAGETDLVDLKVGTENYKVLIKDTQFNPITGTVIHASFYKPDLSEKIETQIPVEVIGEEENPLVKTSTGMVFYVVDEITVKALPTDLPHAFVIDVSKMETVGETVTVAQLNYDKSKVEIIDLEPEDPVIRMDAMEEQKEEETVVTEEEAIAGVEVTKEKKEDEEESEEDTNKKGKEK